MATVRKLRGEGDSPRFGAPCVFWLRASLSLWLSSPGSLAADSRQARSWATRAMPCRGCVHVPVAGAINRTGASLAATGGYGYTEGVLGRGDRHNRLFGTLSGSVRPDRGGGPCASTSRYNHVGDSRWQRERIRRGSPPLRPGRHGPAARPADQHQVGVWVPGNQPPSLVFKATTLNLVAMAAYAPAGSPLVLAVHAGGRWDNSAASVPDADRLADSARLGLGINDASGILSGLGASYPIARRLELLGDVSADWLIGSSAPSALESPIVVALGARWDANERGTLSLQFSLEASPSERPNLAPPHPLVDVEPRVAAAFGLVLRPGAAAVPRAPEPEAPEEAPPASDGASRRADLCGPQGPRDQRGGRAPRARAGAPHARGAGCGRVARARGGDRRGRELPARRRSLGMASLEVQAQGYAVAHRDLTIDVAPAAVAIALDPAIPPAQIADSCATHRQTRRRDGRHRAPRHEREREGRRRLEVEVKPGTYDVVITAKGYAPQRRKVVVEPQGVTLLNVDLRSAR